MKRMQLFALALASFVVAGLAGAVIEAGRAWAIGPLIVAFGLSAIHSVILYHYRNLK